MCMSFPILVVEDEPLIRLGMAFMLEDAGFAVVEAANADEAIERLERNPNIRVIITDVDMPGTMDGVKLAHYVRRQWPPIQLIVVSGKVGLKDIELPEGTEFLSKPYQDAHLLRVIEKVTGAAGAR